MSLEKYELSYQDQRKHKEAIECFDKAVNLVPNYALYLVDRGRSLNILGKRKEALDDFRKGFVDVDMNPRTYPL